LSSLAERNIAVWSAVWRVGFDAEAFDVGEIVSDVVAFVEVERAGEVFDVDDVGRLGVGEAENGEGAAGGECPPAWNGIICSRMLDRSGPRAGLRVGLA